MNFQTSIKTCLSKYVDFSGRASRSEYWWFILFSFICQVVAEIIHPNLSVIVVIAFLLPSLAVLARRLHDIDYSAWWILLFLIPIIGAIILLVFAVTKGTEGQNRFGMAPA